MSTVQTPDPPHCVTDAPIRLQLEAACLHKLRLRQAYLAAAGRLEERRLHVIAHAFRFTAAQEKEHADVLRGLSAACGGAALLPEAEDALPLPGNPQHLFCAALQLETEAGEALLPRIAALALEADRPRIAAACRRMAETDLHHAQRFRRYALALSQGRLFRDEQRVSWLCLACGELHTGQEAPHCCAACGRDRGHFIRSSYHPFLPGG